MKKFGKKLMEIGASLFENAMIRMTLVECINRGNIIADELEKNGFEVER